VVQFELSRHQPWYLDCLDGDRYASGQTFRLQGRSFLWIMAKATLPPKSIGELIDRIERIQEELLSIQRSLERMEPIEPPSHQLRQQILSP